MVEIQKTTRRVKVGEIKENDLLSPDTTVRITDDSVDECFLREEGKLQVFTDQFLSISDEFFADYENGCFYYEEKIEVCSECGYEAMKDERNDEWYCPIHD